ncbi:MAG TPA: tetratricopeptide repeat protein [Kofleriaceae bacterium]|jgi:tetratricopeptide (TPR) repeat protein
MATSRCSLAFALLVACHHARQPSLAPLPAAAYSHYLAGKLAMELGDPTSAADELAAAAAAAPDQPMIAVEEARALAKAKRDGEARALLAATRAAWPEHARVWLASGEVLEKSAPAEASAAYKRAIDLEPADERAYLGLARIELAQKHPRRAEDVLRRLVAHVPASVDGRYQLAQRMLERGALADSIGQLRVVLELDPDQLDARLDLARALRRTGDLAGAIVQTRSAFDRAAQPLDIAEELFWLLCEADDLQGAVDLLTLLDDDRSDADTLATVARLDVGLGRLDQATAIAGRLDTMDAALAGLVRVEVALAKRDPKSALQLAAAIPEDSQARRIADAAIADAELTAGDIAAARAAHVKPDPFFEARVAVAQHDVPAALAILEPILRAHPDDVGALNLAGYLLAEAHQRLADAERYLHHARELAPGDPAILDSWGWLRYAQGKPREAVRALEQAARFAPLEHDILVHLDAARRAARDKLTP